MIDTLYDLKNVGSEITRNERDRLQEGKFFRNFMKK